MSVQLRRDDAIAAGATAGLMAGYFVLPAVLWFALAVLIVGAIVAKTGLR